MSDPASDTAHPRSPGASRPVFWIFILVMLALIGLFIGLGTWQAQRLLEKEELIALVEARLNAPPIEAPAATDWPRLDIETIDYQPMRLDGRFVPDETVKVFANVPAGDARGPFSGPGYWLLTPFVLETDGTVFVNRGFVPEALFRQLPQEASLGERTELVGLARAPEASGSFTPAPDVAARLEWVRDPVRLAAMVDPALAPFAPFTLDVEAGPPGALPQGGETVVEFPNNHLGYAVTWFSFALATLVMLGFWIARQRRRP